MRKLFFVNLFLHFIFIELKSYSATSIGLTETRPTVDSICNDDLHNYFQEQYILLDSLLQSVVILNEQPLTKSQPESSIGNFIADAIAYNEDVHFRSKQTLVVFPYHYIRKEYVPSLRCSYNDILELSAQDYTLVRAEVDGLLLKALVDSMASWGGWPVHGIQYVIDHDGRVKDLMVNGESVHPHRLYDVILPEVSLWSRPTRTLLQNINYQRVEQSVVEALLLYTRSFDKSKTVRIPVQSRVVYED